MDLRALVAASERGEEARIGRLEEGVLGSDDIARLVSTPLPPSPTPRAPLP